MPENEQTGEKESVRKRHKNIPKSLIPSLKKEYLENSNLSIRELAVKYDLPVRALEVRCSREKWRVKESQIVEKVVQNIEKRDNLRLERLHSHELRMIKRMEERLLNVDKIIDQTAGLMEPSDVRSIASTESTIDLVIRRSLGAEDKSNQPGVTLNVNVLGILDKLRAINQGKMIDGDAIEAELRDCKLIEG